ncbi:MAG: DnaJ domain-containing protein [Cyanobacteria bacterium REEB65]|nr:DnaJ domain-containing protein [Cyanobacteria bacterium REEB65]
MSSAATDDLYAVLGVGEDATDEEIRKGYKRLARELHPDRFVGNPQAQRDAQERFAKISNAYNVLKDQTARSEYDFERKMALQRGLDAGIEVVEAPVEETGYKRELGDRKYRYALQLQSEGELGRAIEAVKEAAELCPNVASYRALLGALYSKRGWQSYAKAELERAVRLDPADQLSRRLYKKVLGELSAVAEEEDEGSKKAPKRRKGKRGKNRQTQNLRGTRKFRKRRASFWSVVWNKLLGRSGTSD